MKPEVVDVARSRCSLSDQCETRFETPSPHYRAGSAVNTAGRAGDSCRLVGVGRERPRAGDVRDGFGNVVLHREAMRRHALAAQLVQFTKQMRFPRNPCSSQRGVCCERLQCSSNCALSKDSEESIDSKYV